MAFTVDGVLLRHWRTKIATNAGLGLWLAGALWSDEEVTDGHISHEVAASLGTATQVKLVVKSGLWMECDLHPECHLMRAYHVDGAGRVRRLTPQQRDERKKNDRIRKARSRQTSAPTLDSPAVTPLSHPSHTVTGGGHERDMGVTAGVDTAPSLAVPPLNPPHGGTTPEPPPAKTRKARPKPITEDFAITAAMRAWAEANVPNLDIDRALPEFVSYWLGRGTSMANWEQTWRNGMLRSDSLSNFRRGAAPRVDERPMKRFS